MQNDITTLPTKRGAKYNGREGMASFEPIEFSDLARLSTGDVVWFQRSAGDFVRAKINGKPKTWKRDPNKLQLSLKYGFHGPYWKIEVLCLPGSKRTQYPSPLDVLYREVTT